MWVVHLHARVALNVDHSTYARQPGYTIKHNTVHVAVWLCPMLRLVKRSSHPASTANYFALRRLWMRRRPQRGCAGRSSR
jgi:hypothetical protein